ncbi:MAG: hypothetical protein KDA90_08475 [Planctomycetaceae bacterium]|nr:hypothetical protein [Planctomycetaceae bacterium]
MPTTFFTDLAGREWDTRFRFSNVRNIAKSTGVTLPDLIHPGSESLGLIADQATFFDVLWLLLAQQATATGVDENSFAEAMDGATFEAAFDALVEAAILHAPAHQTARLRAAVTEVRKAQELGLQLACDLVSQSLADVEAKFAALQPRISGG